jgi:two-component system response regulator PilR (NtrC family)
VTPSPLLIIEDEPDLRQLYELALVKIGLAVDAVGDVASARQRLAQQRYRVVVTDMRLPDGTGLDLLRELARDGRGERTIVITAYGSADNAVEALKAGAFDYLTKPVTPARLRQAIATALAAAPQGAPAPAAPRAGDTPPPAPNEPPAALQRLVGDSPAMHAVRQTIQRVARTMAPVLITGESGTGKELIARALHACSHRASGPFVAVNCGAIPAELLESELFGHRRGAFTGASADKPGLFQAAAGGTLFLDEVADLPLAMQVKLLRALQERAVRPVGATTEEPVDVRLVSATHKDLARLVQGGQFRHDLYYRLNVIPIHAPALRDHLPDLPAIAQAILERLAQRDGLPRAPTLTPAALDRLRAHPFPGNVRELENLLERALALHPGPVLDADAFTLLTPPTATMGDTPMAPTTDAPSRDADAPLSRAQLEALLQRHRWNQSRTARELGWTLAKLRYWMQRLGVG